MRKAFLLPFILSVLVSNAQPKLVGSLAYLGPQNGGSIFKDSLPVTIPSIIHSFNNLSPHAPVGGMCAGNADWLYGLLNYNGTDNSGGLFRIKRDGTGFTMLYKLSASGAQIPYYHTDGYVYFTDAYTIKKYNPNTNAITDVGSGGAAKTLLIDTADWIFSSSGYTISKIKTDGTGYTTLYTFNGATDGLGGYAGLAGSPGDSLWGVQLSAGTNDLGTLYSIKKDGTGFHVHYQFDGTHGSYPESKPVYFDGKIYGTTVAGGSSDFGVLYCMNVDGTNFRILHQFDPGTPAIGNIAGNISISSDGRIFGSFLQFYYSGGTPYRLFKMDTSGANFQPFIDVYSYNQRNSGHFNLDVLLTDNDETIFLATQQMGRYEGGALSQFDTAGVGNSLYQFGYAANGFKPVGGLIKGSNGKLYGSAQVGGTDGAGIIYSMNTNGTGYTKLHELTDAEGYDLLGKLLEASDGKLYGTTQWGGPTNSGCLFRMDKNGSNFQVLYSFGNFSEGYSPVGSLAEDNNGVLYGNTFYGSLGGGSVFKINKDGSNYTMLKSFDGANSLQYPYAGLTIVGNYLYGVCGYGGADNRGGVFRIKKDGSGYQDLHIFTGTSDGASPRSVLYLANNGKLYGTTLNGGANGEGTIFRIDTSGSNYTILKSFSSTIDGGYPEGGVIQASNLLLYGTTSYSNISGTFGGTLYKMNLDGSGFTLLHAFDDQTEGQAPSGLLDLKGNFVLPVELISFNAQKRDGTVLLTWKTAQEQNSDRFEIERSPDGLAFINIGTLAAAGDTHAISSYSFTDHAPLNGINYYRLKQIDKDGSFTYSKVISVSFDAAEKLIVFPNPASDHLYVRLPQGSRYTTIRVLDAAGKIVFQKSITLSAMADISVQALPKGWYVLQLAGENSVEQVFLKE